MIVHERLKKDVKCCYECPFYYVTTDGENLERFCLKIQDGPITNSILDDITSENSQKMISYKCPCTK